jgi:hypothetical protein
MSKTFGFRGDSIESMVQRLRSLAAGKDVWRVQDKDDKSYVMQFEDWQEHEAKHWWNNCSERDICKNRELVKVRIQSQKDLLMQEAADMLECIFLTS